MEKLKKSVFLVPLVTLLLGSGPAVADTAIWTCGNEITEPGDYFLPNDLFCPGDGILVTADDVEINLNGFTIWGPGIDAGTFIGIGTTDGANCVAVTRLEIEGGNDSDDDSDDDSDGDSDDDSDGDSDGDHGGTVRGFDEGIHICGKEASVKGVTATDNRVGMFFEQGEDIDVVNNHIENNGADQEVSWGLIISQSKDIEVVGNVVSGNESDRFEMSTPSTFCGGIQVTSGSENINIIDNKVNGNGSEPRLGDRFNGGGFAIFISGSSHNIVVDDNNVDDNFRIGVGVFGDDNTIEDNTVNQNDVVGIRVFNSANNNTLEDNEASGNGGDFDLRDDNPNCDNNDWDDNTFGTSNQSCIQ